MENLLNSLTRNLDPSKQLMTAVSCNRLNDLDELISNGLDVNIRVQVQGGNRALHVAAKKGHKECMERLLQAGANPDYPNDFGLCPLIMALRHNQVDCAEILFSHGNILSDPYLTWNSRPGMVVNPALTTFTWNSYSSDILKLVMIATPNMQALDPEVIQSFYESQIQFFQNPDLLKIYLMTGSRLNQDQCTKVLVRAPEDVANWLRAFQTVHNLQHYARLTIRRNLRPNVFAGTKVLPLPVKMLEYLILKDGV